MFRVTFTDQKVRLYGVALFMMVVLCIAGFFSWKQYERNQKIQKEIAVLEAERARVQRENESLKNRINYFATEEFKEQEAKSRLNMRKSDEYVVEIQQSQTKEEEKQVKRENGTSASSDDPYYKKWWEKFLSKEIL